MAHAHDRPRSSNATRGVHLRISDADRAQVTDALCRHYSEGRLDHNELEERTAAVARAKTRAELTPLLADLPPLPGEVAPAVPRRRGVRPVLLALVAVIAVLWAWALVHAAFHAVVFWILVGVAFVALRRHRGYRLGRHI